jgi:hypothetical protein
VNIIMDGITDLRTPHHMLMLALVPVSFHTAWFEFRDSGSIQCLLCGRTIGDARDIWTLRTIEEHEQRHVEALGTEKVAAAEMLYRLRLDETASTVIRFIQTVYDKNYSNGSLKPAFYLPEDPKLYRSVIEEIWGSIPSVALPDHNNQQGPQP